MAEDSMGAVRRAKAQFEKSVSRDVEIAGIGIGLSEQGPALKVNLRRMPADRSLLPETVEGVRVIYDVVGPISKS
jgi:hypothetical protein